MYLYFPVFNHDVHISAQALAPPTQGHQRNLATSKKDIQSWFCNPVYNSNTVFFSTTAFQTFQYYDKKMVQTLNMFPFVVQTVAYPGLCLRNS